MREAKNAREVKALREDELDAVVGGVRIDSVGPCGLCFLLKPLAEYHDPVDTTKHKYICADCARDIGYVR